MKSSKIIFSMILITGLFNVALAKGSKYDYKCFAQDNQAIAADGSDKVEVKFSEGENDDNYKLSFAAKSRGAAIFVSIGDSNTGDYDDQARVTIIKDNIRAETSGSFNAKTNSLTAHITTNVSSNEFFNIECFRKLKSNKKIK